MRKPFTIWSAWGAVAALSLLPAILTPTRADAALIQLNGTDTGRIFDGIGGLSAGASSRLLIDYPAKQRDEILDFLFKPDFGAALQINKVEIGGDCNSTDGSEPSHMHAADDQNYSRGYEWWLMQESKKRNPHEKLYGLEWGTPGWINPNKNDTWTQDNVTYLLNWLRHAKSDYGLTIDYLGGWNERGYNKPWYENFRAALSRSGFAAVKLVAADSFQWQVGTDAGTDLAFNSAVDVIGIHYPEYSPKLAANPDWQASLKTGKPLWGSEMGWQPYDTGAANLAKNYNQGYVAGRMTAFVNWATVWSVYDVLPFRGDGLMQANEPWSGHYAVAQAIWVTAQTTQFAQPGWQYLDGACGYLDDNSANGSYVTLKSPNGRDFSLIAETVDAARSQTAEFAISGGLSAGTLHVWRTNVKSSETKDWFIRLSDISPTNGMFSVTLQPGCVYSVTTTTGQAKGSTTPPPAAPLVLPYREDFHSYAPGATPRLFSDQQGTFAVAAAGAGRKGKCLRQVVTLKPVLWSENGDPSTVVGDSRWADYQVSSDALLEAPGYVDIVGRMMNITSEHSNLINGYHLRVSSSGAWSLLVKDAAKETILASGHKAFAVNVWHRLLLSFALNQISAAIDGSVVVRNLSDNTYSQGLVGYQVSQWQTARFQNLLVTGIPTNAIPQGRMSASATSFQPGYEPAAAIDGNPGSFWHSEFAPEKASLPQAITVDLGNVYTVSSLGYLPRQDGSEHGRITKYVIYASRDGAHFSQAASGAWADNPSQKYAALADVKARYFRLEALAADAGYAAAAEIKLYGVK